MYGGVGQDDADDFDEGEDDFIFNEYAIDDTLDSLTRLERYHTSDFSLQRLVLVRELADTATEAGYQETVARLLPLLGNFVADTEPAVRQTFVEHLFPLATFLIEKGNDQGYNELINTFLPYCFELLVDKNVEVGAAAVTALIKLVDLVKQEQVEPQLLNVVVTLAHDERAEDYRVVAAQLFNELAPRFGEKLCKDTVIEEITKLSEDMSFSVRKMVASNLGKICTVIGPDLSDQRVLPVFLSLCKDEIWGVRKACAEHLCAISEAVSSSVRTKQLFDVFERFTEDMSRWVRVAAYQQLGPFISTCKPGEVATSLLKFFTDMAFQSENGNDSDLAEYCAYNFPAVLTAVGKERWHELEPAYLTLVKDVQWKVRKSLSYSLHEVATLVGKDLTEKTLTTAFDLFLRDLDEVKVGVVTSISEFVSCLGNDQREKYIPMICMLPTDTDNWRLRNIIAAKLGDLAKLVSPAVCKDTIAELCIKLLEDSVADVRTSSFGSCGIILNRLSQGAPSDRTEFLDYLKKLPTSINYQTRQMYIYIAKEVAVHCSRETFEGEFLGMLHEMTTDKVPNVRLTFARTLSSGLLKLDQYKHHPKLASIKEALMKDEDRDVAYFSQHG